MSGQKVVALGIDAADPVLVERWMAEGRLPHLAGLRARGAYGRIESTVELNGQRMEAFSTEPLWVDFATACKPTKTGAWDSIEYFPDRYEIRNLDEGAPAYDRFEPFYALGETRKVAVLDIPMARLSSQVNGAQVLGWGGHFPHTRSHSMPEGLLADLIERHGANPILSKDAGIWWDKPYLKWLERALTDSVAARTSACKDLMQRDEWDLFVGIFSETHSAGHEVYCFSQPDHPLHATLGVKGEALDVLRRTYEQIDRAIGEIARDMPPDAHLLCFSLHGMGPNYSDLLSSVVLPEMLYRISFPGEVALAPGKAGTPPGPMLTRPRRHTWVGEMWSRYVDADPVTRFVRSWLPGRLLRGSFKGLASPFAPQARAKAMLWHPTMWYRPLWPRMKAFALPGFTKGRIRINVAGRDRDGIVAAGEYDRLCDDIEAHLHRLRDGRTGLPVVKKVYRTRRNPLDDDPSLPAFDLDVLWHERITDVVESPDVGRIGPVPHFRAGGHWNRGFVMACGPGIAAGSSLRTAEAVDLGPTILELMGCPVPEHLDGRSLLPGPGQSAQGTTAPLTEGV